MPGTGTPDRDGGWVVSARAADDDVPFYSDGYGASADLPAATGPGYTFSTRGGVPSFGLTPGTIEHVGRSVGSSIGGGAVEAARGVWGGLPTPAKYALGIAAGLAVLALLKK